MGAKGGAVNMGSGIRGGAILIVVGLIVRGPAQLDKGQEGTDRHLNTKDTKGHKGKPLVYFASFVFTQLPFMLRLDGRNTATRNLKFNATFRAWGSL